MNNLANTKQTEITGGNVNYYLINIPHPKRLDPYVVVKSPQGTLNRNFSFWK